MWKEIGKEGESSGDFIKWDQDGMEIEGVWMGEFISQKGNRLGRMKLGDGTAVFFTMPTVLHGNLGNVAKGKRIRIVYVGTKRGAEGYHYKSFKTYEHESAEG